MLSIERSDALQSDGWAQGSWDCIFVLGPLYHMTRTGALVYGIKNDPEEILYPDGATILWETGTDDRFVEATEWFTMPIFLILGRSIHC